MILMLILSFCMIFIEMKITYSETIYLIRINDNYDKVHTMLLIYIDVLLKVVHIDALIKLAHDLVLAVETTMVHGNILC